MKSANSISSSRARFGSVRISEEIVVVAGGALDAQSVRELTRRRGSASSNPHYFHIAETAQLFGVDPAHETNAKDGDLQFFHSL